MLILSGCNVKYSLHFDKYSCHFLVNIFGFSGEFYMEFKNREEMIEFEEKRINYYLESINAIDQGRIFTFYRLWLREIFVPKYRKLKKLYDSYSGGWYRDENGYIHASYPHLVETNNLLDGEMLIADYGGFDNISSDIYFLKNKTWIKIASPDALKKILEEKENENE